MTSTNLPGWRPRWHFPVAGRPPRRRTMADILRVEDDADGIRVLTLNRPDRLNALNGDLVNAVRGAVRDCQATDKRVILIRGEGRAFCAGADLKWLASGVLADTG